MTPSERKEVAAVLREWAYWQRTNLPIVLPECTPAVMAAARPFIFSLTPAGNRRRLTRDEMQTGLCLAAAMVEIEGDR